MIVAEGILYFITNVNKIFKILCFLICVRLFIFLLIILHRDEIIVDRQSESPVAPQASAI